MAHSDMRPISFTYPSVASMWVVTHHNLFLYSDPSLPCHPTSYWLSLVSSQTFSRINTPTFSKILIKQLIRPMMHYTCPAWRSAARSHVRRLQVLQPKCLRLATGAPWYVSNMQIHEDLGVSLFAYHVRALTASFNSKLTDVENPHVRQLSR
jgi:hypothetical protein